MNSENNVDVTTSSGNDANARLAVVLVQQLDVWIEYHEQVASMYSEEPLTDRVATTTAIKYFAKADAYKDVKGFILEYKELLEREQTSKRQKCVDCGADAGLASEMYCAECLEK